MTCPLRCFGLASKAPSLKWTECRNIEWGDMQLVAMNIAEPAWALQISAFLH